MAASIKSLEKRVRALELTVASLLAKNIGVFEQPHRLPLAFKDKLKKGKVIK